MPNQRFLRYIIFLFLMVGHSNRSWKFLGIVLLIAILAISAAVIWEFTDVLLLGLALAYIVYPAAKKIYRKKIKADNRWMVSSLISVLLIAIPLMFVFFYGMNYLLHWFINNLPAVESGRFLADITYTLENAGLGIVSTRIASEIGKVAVLFSGEMSRLVLNPTWLIEVVLKVALFFVSAVYFVYEAPRIGEFLDKNIPREEKFIQELMKAVDRILYGLFVGHFFTSVIISILFSAGYWFIFRPDLLTLSIITVIMFVIAFLPLIGPWFVYVPLSLWHMFFAPFSSFGQGVALLIYSVIFLTIISGLYIRPKLVQRGAEIHPFLIILGFFGGPMVFGVKGIILGPLVLGLAQAILKLYVEKRHILKELVDHF